MGVHYFSQNVCLQCDRVKERSFGFCKESDFLHKILTYIKCGLIPVAALFFQIMFGLKTNAQFTDIAPGLGVTYESDFGFMVGASTYDFNKDGWDDLTICTNNHGIRTFQNNDGNFEEIFLFDYLDGFFKTPTWVDLDNDGDADFFASGNQSSSVLFRNEGNLQFTDLTGGLNLPIYDARSYSASWGDYDNDSFLDLYLSNYYMNGTITNWLLHNNQDFTFTEVALQLGVDNGVKTSYQSGFFDYDIDGDMDIFVTNDRSFGNALYQNNGDGTFTDVSVETGTDVIMEAMCLSFSDVDSDGDFDYFVSNTESGSILMENNNGVYSNIAESANMLCLGTVAWGACFIDYDNNGVNDVYVANVNPGNYQNDQNYFFMQADEGSFEIDTSTCFMNDDFRSYSVATADFDQNGYEDFAVTNVWPATVSIWQNNSEFENHWIKVGLTGTVSNADAIGATIQVYTGDHLAMKQITCGESFLAQCSQYELFGIESAELVDSLLVMWPGGWVDRYYNLNVNQFYSFTEGETFVDVFDYQTLQLCTDSSLILDAGESAFYSWSTGDTLAAISVDEPGIYSVGVEGYFNLVHTIEFEVFEFIFPQIEANITSPKCYGDQDGSIELLVNSIDIQSIEWSGDFSGYTLSDLAEGSYAYELVFTNGCILQDEIVLEAPAVLEIYCPSDSVCENSSVEVQWQAIGGTGPYDVLWNDIDPMFCAAGEYSVSVVDQLGCVDSTTFVITEIPLPEVLLEYDPICFEDYAVLEYEVINGTGTYVFDFDEVDTDHLTPGEYQGIVYDENYCTSSFEFEIEENEELEVTYEIINAEDGSNGSITLNVEGGLAPFQYDWNDASMESNLLNVAAGSYSCTITDAIGCSVFVEMQVIDLSIEEARDEMKIYPIPFSNEIYIDASKPSKCDFYDTQGRLILTEKTMSGLSRINTTHLEPGVYFLRTNNSIARILKQ